MLDTLLRELTNVLTAAGLPSEYAMHSSQRATLTVASAKMSVMINYRSTVIIAGGRFRRAPKSGYNVRKMVGHILALLPHFLENQKRQETRDGCIAIAKELAGAHAEDGRLAIGWEPAKGFYVSFASHDYTTVAVAADKLHEMGDYGQEFQEPVASGPPRFRLENDEGELVGDEKSMFQVVGEHTDLEEGHYDDLATCKLNCRVLLGDFWYTRVS